MFQFKRILIISLIFVLTQAQQIQENLNANDKVTSGKRKLDVIILYESLCPDSVRFMKQQLAPSYDELKDYIEVTLVPFGKSYSENNGAEFYCQHGPAECNGNRMQSCVLNQTTDQDKQVQFAICQMTTFDRSSVKDCAESAGLSGDIDECMTTQTGTKLQLNAEAITEHFSPSFVPTIVYDKVFNQQLQDSSIRNFRGTVCRLLQQNGIIGLTTPQGTCG